jgi:hypothetical protein
MLKKILLLLIVLTAVSFAIDGARGIGKDKSKLEVSYTGGSLGVQYDFGMNRDWTMYGSVMSAGGFSGFGVGTKYAILNEKKGDDFSLAPKLDLLLGSGGVLPVIGLVGSKKLESFTVLGDVSTWATGPLSYTWIGGGALFDINKDWQLSGEIGMATVSFMGYKGSGFGIAVGTNYIF